MWQSALSVRTEIRELEWKVYLATRHAPGDCDLVRLGWSADFIAPEAFLAMFGSEHTQNTLGYRNAAYDALLDQAAVAADSTARVQMLADAESLLLEDVPAIPIFFRSSKRLVKPQVKGYQDNPLGHLASRQLRIEQ
jgi:ABC-type oligopeptide transport system substrate-binding subunit